MKTIKRNFLSDFIDSLIQFSFLNYLCNNPQIKFSVNNNDVTITWENKGELKDSKVFLERKCIDNELEWENKAALIDDLSMYGNSIIHFYDIGLKNGKYIYRVKKIEKSGKIHLFNLHSIITINTNSLKDLSKIKFKRYFSIYHYPCTIDYSILIKFILPTPTFVKLTLIDDLNRECIPIVNKYLKAGVHKYNTKLHNEDLKTGIYHYCMEAYGVSDLRKMDYEIGLKDNVEINLNKKQIISISEPISDLKFA